MKGLAQESGGPVGRLQQLDHLPLRVVIAAALAIEVGRPFLAGEENSTEASAPRAASGLSLMARMH